MAEFPTITREEIGKKLQEKYDSSKDLEPVDCFYLQVHYSFREWIDTVKVQKEIEQKMGEVIEEFLRQRMRDGPIIKPLEDGDEVTITENWYKLIDWWPLTYFLDCKSHGKGSLFRPSLFSDRDVEMMIDDDVRKKLREELRAADPSFGDVPIIITRACKYTAEET